MQEAVWKAYPLEHKVFALKWPDNRPWEELAAVLKIERGFFPGAAPLKWKFDKNNQFPEAHDFVFKELWNWESERKLY